MSIAKILIDDGPVSDFLNSFSAFLSSGTIAPDAGDFAVDRILSRTKSGKDINDSPFAAYSFSYGKSGTVNLTVTGDMLGSITSTVMGDAAAITCESDIAQYHEQGTNKMPQRQFMGLSNTDVEDMLDTAFFDPLESAVS